MKSEGIVISTTDYKESSKIVNLYTKEGKISVNAKGALNPKKGLLGFITTGNIVSFVTTDSNTKTLLEYELIRSVYDLNESIDKIKAFGIIIDIIKEISDDINHEKCYDFIKKILLSLKNNDTKKVLSIFLIKMLYIFGINPNLKTCVRCNNDNLVSFSVHLGGALCNNCSSQDLDYLNIWKEYYYDKKDIALYSDTDFNKLLNDIFLYYSYHMSIKLKF